MCGNNQNFLSKMVLLLPSLCLFKFPFSFCFSNVSKPHSSRQVSSLSTSAFKHFQCARKGDGMVCEGKPPRNMLIVGDVHACMTELDLLMTKTNYDEQQDAVVFVGDLIGKGPRGLDVLQYVKEKRAPCVLGNHEDYILKTWRQMQASSPVGVSLDDIQSQTHRATAKAMSDDEWQWLHTLPLWIHFPAFNTIVVHAGMVPGVDRAQQKPFDMMYMRNLLPASPATSSSSSGPSLVASPKVDAGEAWAPLWRGPEHIVFGHDAKRMLQKEAFATGIDTGACYGKQLTALVLPSRQLVQVDSVEVYVDPEEKIKY